MKRHIAWWCCAWVDLLASIVEILTLALFWAIYQVIKEEKKN
jgi:hypothetical protein